MRKTGRGLKDGLLLLVLAVAVVTGPGCAGEEVTGNDGVITTAPAVETTTGADAEKETEGQVTEPVVPTEEPGAVTEPVLPTGAPEADDDETQKEASHRRDAVRHCERDNGAGGVRYKNRAGGTLEGNGGEAGR